MVLVPALPLTTKPSVVVAVIVEVVVTQEMVTILDTNHQFHVKWEYHASKWWAWGL